MIDLINNVNPTQEPKRPGQPKKAPTKVLSVRILEEDYDALKAKIEELVKDYKKDNPTKLLSEKGLIVLKPNTLFHPYRK